MSKIKIPDIKKNTQNMKKFKLLLLFLIFLQMFTILIEAHIL